MELALVQTYSVRYVGELSDRTIDFYDENRHILAHGALMLRHPAEMLIGTAPAQDMAGRVTVGAMLIAVPLPMEALEISSQHIVAFSRWTVSEDHGKGGELDQVASAYINSRKQASPLRPVQAGGQRKS